MTATKKLGVYVHIPFCKKKCNYCDFCSRPADDAMRAEYTARLVDEILSQKEALSGYSANTVFFGGGTPSVMKTEELRAVLEAIKECVPLSSDCEISIEVNPGTVNAQTFSEYKRVGFNRISIGMQSIHEGELRALGRIHSFEDFLSCVEAARASGFSNINADVMYGIPNQSRESFSETVNTLISLDIPHISCYGLIIEEGTPFYEARESLALPSEDEECDMYESAHEALTERGYSHYEISNYAKAGYECRHNLKYWQSEEYIGFGISAHSYLCGKRFYNTGSFSEYFSDSAEKYKQNADASADGREFEYAMLGLRLRFGFSLAEYESKFGKDFLVGREKLIEEYVKLGLMKTEGGRIFLTYKGFYVSNSILSSLL